MAHTIGEVTVKVNLEASEELRAFIRAEVRKALSEVASDLRVRQGLPSWTRFEEGVGTQGSAQ